MSRGREDARHEGGWTDASLLVYPLEHVPALSFGTLNICHSSKTRSDYDHGLSRGRLESSSRKLVVQSERDHGYFNDISLSS